LNVITRMLPASFEMTVPKPPDEAKVLGRFFQAYPPAEHSWPVAIVEAIRRDIDPEFCPMWCWTVYRHPDSSITKEGRHWLWVEQRDRIEPKAPPRYLPAAYGVNAGRRPNVALDSLEQEATPYQRARNLSGDYIDFGWWVYWKLKFMKDTYDPDPDHAMDEILKASGARESEALGKLQKETEYRWSHDDAYLQKLAGKIGSVDAKAGFATEFKKKPFVEVRKRSNS